MGNSTEGSSPHPLLGAMLWLRKVNFIPSCWVSLGDVATYYEQFSSRSPIEQYSEGSSNQPTQKKEDIKASSLPLAVSQGHLRDGQSG